jgi:urea transport system permease protein
MSKKTRRWLCVLQIVLHLMLYGGLHEAVAEEGDGVDVWSDAVGKLAARSLRDRQAALESLVASGDARLLPLLEAMDEGRLLQTAEGLVIRGPDGIAIDVLSMQPTGSLGEGRRFTLNNQMRITIAGALSAARVVGGDRATRLRALEEMLTQPPDPLPPALLQSLEREPDPVVVRALQAVVAMADLRIADPARQLAAIAVLAERMHPEVHNRLTALAVDEAADGRVREAAADALRALDARRQVNAFLETAYFGLGLGAVLALCAIGLAITFGVMGVINMAHGEMMMLGAYATFVVQQAMPDSLEYSLLVALPAAFLLAAVSGLVIEWLVVSRLYGRPLETLLATFGLSLVLQQAVRSIFGATNRAVSSPAWMSGSFAPLDGLELTWGRLYVILFCLLVFAALGVMLGRTRLGLQIRAVAQNRQMARALGVPARRVDAMTFALGSGIAGLAGVALSQLTNVGPNLGQAYIVDAFMVVVFGGVGSLWGTLVAGFSLGMLSKFLEPSVGAVLGKVLVLAGIVIFIQRYPRGLFPMRGRSVEP